VGSTACAGKSTDGGNASNAAITSPTASVPSTAPAPLSDADLESAIAKAPLAITSAEANALFAQTVAPVPTSKRLSMLNAFIARGLADGKDDVYDDMALQMEALILGTPKDIASAPAAFGGQTLTTAIVTDETSLGPSSLSISGTAASAYTISFKIGGSTLTADIPAGATAAQTAARIGDVIRGSAETIAGSMGSPTDGFADIGGDHSESPSGVDDVEVSVDGATISILVALNG